MSDVVQQIREALEARWEWGAGRRPKHEAALAALARVEATLNEALQIREGYISPVQKVMQARRRAEAAEARVVAAEAERDLEKEWGRGQADLLTECATACEEAEGALHDLYVIALNGVVCTPPYTWSDPFLGGDGSGRMFDVEAMKCEECKRAWRKVDAYFSTTGASGALRDPAPAPGLGAGSVIDSQPSAKEPAPSTEEEGA